MEVTLLFILFIDSFNVSIPPQGYPWAACDTTELPDTSVSNFEEIGKILPVLVSIQTFLYKHTGHIHLIFQYVVRISHFRYSRAKRGGF